MRPVVVGFDGSLGAAKALDWAADAAVEHGVGLIIVCATWPSPATSGTIPELLERAEDQALVGRPGLAVSSSFVTDNSAGALIEASETAGIVVVGSRGHGGFHDLLLGSTSMHTAMHAHCPVAVIRPTQLATAASAESTSRIVVGVDGSPHSGPALDFAFEHATCTGHAVSAVRAWQRPMTTEPMGVSMYDTGSDDQRAQEEHLLAEALLPWQRRYPDVDIRQVTLQMSSAEAMVQQSMGAYLTVVGSRGHGGFASLLLGSTGQALIHHGGGPVVIAHQPTG